jgi:hypothetical protein
MHVVHDRVATSISCIARTCKIGMGSIDTLTRDRLAIATSRVSVPANTLTCGKVSWLAKQEESQYPWANRMMAPHSCHDGPVLASTAKAEWMIRAGGIRTQ